MAAIPNVHIEWEWRGRTIRNMSLMTFGRQMYLIRESASPAGIIDVELLPTGPSVIRSSSDDESHRQAVELNELVQTSEQHRALLNSLLLNSNSNSDNNNNANAPQRRYISAIPGEPETFQSSARAVQSVEEQLLVRKKRADSTRSVVDSGDPETYRRTSTLYIMNALEKDSGR